jgi:hypothetical protein
VAGLLSAASAATEVIGGTAAAATADFSRVLWVAGIIGLPDKPAGAGAG